MTDRSTEKSHWGAVLAIVNGGNALATVIAAPLGSFLGTLIGWRAAFFCVVPVAALAALWLLLSLPSLPA
ncbi:MFS transporter, partial [Pseudomonas asplenii]|uniref:MFS transporter n=1 Tax=Pseudomonas asplenii TaxID=53407 RepID=UPI0006CDE996